MALACGDGGAFATDVFRQGRCLRGTGNGLIRQGVFVPDILFRVRRRRPGAFGVMRRDKILLPIGFISIGLKKPSAQTMRDLQKR